ncbi:MAG TPA: hypothetical protein VHD63_01470, partial [Ktedonobacteraceae bacterium]|nr:hypothetical protein [Ktedonobacteraceae bacterium]
RDVVVTIYDTIARDLSAIRGLEAQQHLRKRVACVKYFENLSAGDVAYRNYAYASHYSYDMEGNVQCLVQDFPDLATVKQQYKRIDYDYDVISGKVNMLSYNRGWPDQFYQRYSYDADNRITEVSTSADGFIWKRDAAYSYYAHGPLARVQLGHQAAQGVDYAYTIEGWLKAVNGDTLITAGDMGSDGADIMTSLDAVSYTVDYFKNDYKSISGRNVQHISAQSKDLFNGNIARQTVAIDTFGKLSKAYVYDQLNRIHDARYSGVDASGGTLTQLNDYHNYYEYDADGNITRLVRNGSRTATGVHLMDSLVYRYDTGSHNNRLLQVRDYADSAYANDIAKDTSGRTRYQYDLTGNTIEDLVSGQDTVEWNLYGKVTATRNRAARNNMRFMYDGMGNRVARYFTQATDSNYRENNDYYVRDAQGNILAIYRDRRVYHGLTAGGYVHAANPVLRMMSGGSATFNAQFVAPVYGHDGAFASALLSAATDSFTTAELAGKSVSYFTSRSPAMYYNMLFADTGYIAPLIDAERSGGDTIITPALLAGADALLQFVLDSSLTDTTHHGHYRVHGHLGDNPSVIVHDGYIEFTGVHDTLPSYRFGYNHYHGDMDRLSGLVGLTGALGAAFGGATADRSLHLLCTVAGGDSILRDMALAISYLGSPADTTGVTAVVDSIMGLGCDVGAALVSGAKVDGTLLGTTIFMIGMLNNPHAFRLYLPLLITDTTLNENGAYRSGLQAMLPQLLATFGSRYKATQFFDGY